MLITSIKNKQKKLLIYLGITFPVIVLYTMLSRFWVPYGHGYTSIFPQIFKLEVPLLLTILTLFYYQKIQNKFVKHLSFPALIIMIYLLFDIFYIFLGKSPSPSDFQNLSLIFEFSLEMGVGFLMFFALIPLIFFVWFFHLTKEYVFKTLIISLSVRLFFLSLLLFFFTTKPFDDFQKNIFKHVIWSQENTIRYNGRFSSFLFYANQQNENYLYLKKYSEKNKAIDIHKSLYPNKISTPRNIHMIVLESFIDPRLIQNLRFNRTPLSKNLIPYLLGDKGKFSQIISPVYGGGTAQAEFELLTGIKALEKVNSIEFNVMNGGKINGFSKLLSDNNYATIATIATSSKYFNSKKAYESLGFDTVTYLQEDKEFIKKMSNPLIFDGDVLDYNLKKIRHFITSNNRPVFNYILGIYGHIPFRRDYTKRPDTIRVETEDAKLRRIVNQFYYRTKAIEDYIKNILSIDRNSIIYITSDHLPSILSNDIVYKYNKYNNISLFINNGITIDVTGKHLYEIPWLIWDLLSTKSNPRNIQSKHMENLYYKALSESISL